MQAAALMQTGLELLDKTTGEIVHFDPGGVLITDAKHDAVIDLFARLKDWQAVESEIDKKLDHQEAAVSWWHTNVRGDGRPPKTGHVLRPFTKLDAENLTRVSHQQISRWNQRLKKRMSYRTAILLAAVKKYSSIAAANYLAQGTGENEWYTPPEIIALVRQVLGDIDLDPASDAKANETVGALAYFTAEDNGLIRDWNGRVWLNPPYSRDLMPAFVNKLMGEYAAGRTTAAILVSHNNTETQWFQSLASVATALCFPAMRIKFYRGEDVAAPVNGQVFFYLGADPARFVGAFRSLGIIVACVDDAS